MQETCHEIFGLIKILSFKKNTDKTLSYYVKLNMPITETNITRSHLCALSKIIELTEVKDIM